MKIGDRCPYKVGFVITEISGKCPHHGCDTFVARDAKRTHYLNFCVECRKEGRSRYHKESYRRQKEKRADDYNYVCDHDSEGIPPDWREWLWSYKIDRAIDKFWRVRGMTDEDAIIKFGGHPKQEKPLASGRKKAIVGNI